MDLAARSAPPVIDVEDGLGSMRSIVFPVLGPVAYANGWGDPRSGGRRHEGTDIVGVRMQPVLAAVDGVISRYQPTSIGIRGVAISIADEDGWRYNYFHNNDDTPGTDDGAAAEAFRLAPGLELGASVVAGQIIGYMGDSGNAEESVAHLHFELRDPTGRARPSFWSLRAAEARQACTIGIGPWSTPTVGELTVDDADPTVAVAVAVAPANVASIVAPPVDAVAAAAVADPPVEHTVVTPMYGEGQWVIDSEGRVTATGDAALIMPRRDLQCDVGPATPFGTDGAGWDEVGPDALDGTVLADADLSGTVLDAVIPEPPPPVIPSLLEVAHRVTAKNPTAPSPAGAATPIGGATPTTDGSRVGSDGHDDGHRRKRRDRRQRVRGRRSDRSADGVHRPGDRRDDHRRVRPARRRSTEPPHDAPAALTARRRMAAVIEASLSADGLRS